MSILFNSNESYQAEVQALVDAYLDNFNQVTTALAVSSALTEEERQAATLPIQLSVQEVRVQPVADLSCTGFPTLMEWVPVL